ncbi:hypothetical protein [Photorhabdus luminescens]|uniref:Uncharacterized protein n=1 Tax=Photorhabdus luminescens subsp. mexicana TaxID=2100167 RepID=A0A4R4J328_PHOLU|nr:hypothetical protein [Photorhabdus luminescens]TDB47880.1 hypothetical protein C5468_17465 [Photorhabdus luminescens subsp. mexicana]
MKKNILMFLLFISLSVHAKEILSLYPIPRMVIYSIYSYVSKDFLPLPLSIVKYTEISKDIQENGYSEYYIYSGKVNKIYSNPDWYVTPFVYSTENKEKKGEGYARCNMVAFSDNRVLIPEKTFKSKYAGNYSSCFGYKLVRVFHVRDLTWIVGEVGYESPQNGIYSEWFSYDYYFFDRKKEVFCFDDNLSKLIRREDKLEIKLMGYVPNYSQCNNVIKH